MAAIELVGAAKLTVLAAQLRELGGNPEGKYPADMMHRTNLVTDGETLFRTRSVPGRDYGQWLEAIAARVA